MAAVDVPWLARDMESTTDPTTEDRIRTLRRRVAVATVIVCLPYLLLKVCWVLGWPIGSSAPGFTDTTRGANVLTAGLEVVAILLAIAFVHPVGRRIPAFVVAFPVWIATGLLTPVVLGFVLGTPVQLLLGAGNPFQDDVLAGWVFGLVYGGFVLEAVLLTAGFVLYCRDRWPSLMTGRAGGAIDPSAVATRPLKRLLSGVFVVAAFAFAVQQASWAGGGGGSFPDPEVSQRVLLAVEALLSAMAGLAAWRLAGGARLTTGTLALVWVGTGVVFTSSLLDTLKTVALAPTAWGATNVGPAEATVTLFILLGALGGAIGGSMHLVEGAHRTPAEGQPAHAGS